MLHASTVKLYNTVCKSKEVCIFFSDVYPFIGSDEKMTREGK
jgi:hypothetical protein